MMRELLAEASQRAGTYLDGVRERAVVPSAKALAELETLRGPVPEGPMEAGAVLELLDRVGSPASMATTGGRYFGFVTGGALPASVAATVLASAWDQNAGLRVMSPVGAVLEDIALGWVADLLGLPTACGGALVTGATQANLCGLAAGREALLDRAGWDVQNDGLFGAPPLRVVVGGEVHISLGKALGILGLGRTRVEKVPADGQGRMRADLLPALEERTLLCLQAGNVNTGSFDPMEEICRKAKEAGAWVHVDGAFGLWAAASPKYKHLTAGMELADSWSTDGHKWPNVGYDCGIVLVREAQTLRAVMGMNAAYLPPAALREPAHYSPEMSRRARGIELWAVLQSLGRSGMADLVERSCALAQQFGAGLRAAGFQVLNDVVLNQVLVSFGDAEHTRSTVARLQAEGVCWCGMTEWQGQVAMRISVSSWATTEEDVRLSLEAMRRAARLA
jgi:glutamate/tyrosine decarboxylase-like PLP-dependent enzyme